MSINYKLAGYRAGLLTLGLNKIAAEAAPEQKDEPGMLRKYVVPGVAALGAAGAAYAGHKYMSGGQQPGSDASRYQQLADLLSSKLPTSMGGPDQTTGPTQGPGLGTQMGGAMEKLKGRLAEKGTSAGLPSEAPPAGKGGGLAEYIKSKLPTQMAPSADGTTGPTQGPGLGTRAGGLMQSLKDRISGAGRTSVPKGTEA